jgi:hypothetical protein
MQVGAMSEESGEHWDAVRVGAVREKVRHGLKREVVGGDLDGKEAALVRDVRVCVMREEPFAQGRGVQDLAGGFGQLRWDKWVWGREGAWGGT